MNSVEPAVALAPLRVTLNLNHLIFFFII